MRLFARSALALLVTINLSGCFYLQATAGHLSLLNKREPIAEVIADPATSESLRRRLQLVDEARDFSIERLALPDNKSYRSYAALERDYVLWSLFAAPADSLTPKTWCYPLVGCLSYRGYFKRETVLRQADKLRAQGFDVAVSGVAAYSTLGKFDDPLLDTMMRWDDVRLVGTLFHELAHQVIYIKGDTTFNESFASAVEDIGLEKWLRERADGDLLDAHLKRKQTARDILRLADTARQELAELYAQKPEGWEASKQERLQQLSQEVVELLAERGSGQGHWLTGELNNAHLIPIALYEGRVSSFRSLFDECDESFACFYAQTKRLGGLPTEARNAELDRLATAAIESAPSSSARRAETRGTESIDSMHDR